MKRRLVLVAVAGTLVGVAASGLWLLEGSGPVDHTRMWQVEPAPAAAKARAPAPGPQREAPGRERPPPREDGPESRPVGRGGAPPADGVVRLDPTPEEEGPPSAMPPEPDTGMPPPDVMLGLPGEQVDDPALIGALAAEPFDLPDRPLSDVEMEALEDRATWLDEACASSPGPDCAQAIAHLEAAVAGARHRRTEAALEQHGRPGPLPPPPNPEDAPPPP